MKNIALILSLLLWMPLLHAIDPSGIAGCKVWLDASDTGSLSLDGQGKVQTWTNKAGTVDAVQTTSGTRPGWSATGLNDKGAVLFTGSEYLEFNGAIRSTAGAYAVYLVTCQTDDYQSPSWQRLISSYSNSSKSANQSPNWEMQRPSEFYTPISWEAGTGKPLPYLPTVSRQTGQNQALTAIEIGRAAKAGTNYYTGRIAEVVIFSRTLGSSEEQQLYDYFNTKWGSAVASVPATSSPSLRELATSLDLDMGSAAVNYFWTKSDATQFQTTFATEYNMLTAENQFKWVSLQPNQGVFTFGPADQHMAFAEGNGIAVHGHTLIWHNGSPSWLSSITSSSQLYSAMDDHITAVLQRYQGRIKHWDVVNEAFMSDGSYRQSYWYNVLGTGYIAYAFEKAHEIDPAAQLLYNDFGIEEINAKSDAVYAMAQSLLANNVPLHGIGFQCHLNYHGIDYTSFAANLQRFANLGLTLHITELDVPISIPISQEKVDMQAEVYRRMLETILAQPAAKSFITWGFTDKYAYANADKASISAMPFDETYQAKAAYYAMRDVLLEATSSSIEYGTISLDAGSLEDAWVQVSFQHTFSVPPVVIARTPSYNGTDPLVTRVRQVTTSGFQMQLDEWEYLSSNGHGTESVSYLAVEPGIYDLDGLKLVAQIETSVGTGDLGTNRPFAEPFSVNPIVFCQVATDHDNQAVSTRINQVKTSTFRVAIQEEEAADNIHVAEDVHVIAIEPGTGVLDGKPFSAFIPATQAKDYFQTFSFGGSYPQPSFFADLQVSWSPDNCALRYQSLTSTDVELLIEEEQSADSETSHGATNVGILVISE